MKNHMEMSANKGIMPYAKSNANVPRFSSADPSPKTPLSPAETCKKNGSAKAKVFQTNRRGF
jgi:hypothetical protein